MQVGGKLCSKRHGSSSCSHHGAAKNYKTSNKKTIINNILIGTTCNGLTKKHFFGNKTSKSSK